MSNWAKSSYKRPSHQRRAQSMTRIANERSTSPSKSVKGVIGDPDQQLTRLLATHSYISEVKATFHKKPEVYRKFAYLLGDLKEPSNNTAAIIQEIVNLFEGYPHLILGLNGFLPYNCELRLQPDAVVIKVHDGETGTETIMKKATNKAGQAIDYISKVKQTLGEDSKKYSEFLQVLQEYHSNERGNKMTIRKIVKLLREYPPLVEGFNAFLPDGFSIEIEKNKLCKVKDQTGEISTITLSHPKDSEKLGRDVK